jgi:two-component system, OmpR family, alkaline phosphatase synthesis response regulator PhoP
MADQTQRPSVIIVEDDAHIAYLLAYLAQKEGFSVEQIADGRSANERLARPPVPELVLLDVMLPYADGFELLANIRATRGWERVPVIIVTAKVHEQDAVRALALGADDYLTKPFSPAELVARMRRRLRRA